MPGQAPRRPIGAHVPVTGGLAAGRLRYAAETGAEAIQERGMRHVRECLLPLDAVDWIGTAPFAALLRHPATRGVPFVAETPGPRAAVAAGMATLKALRGKGRAAPERPGCARPARAMR